MSTAKEKIDPKYIVKINGKDFVKYEGLLEKAHQLKLTKLEVSIVQLPCNENNFEAICKATAESKNGEVFVDIGDACPQNVTKLVVNAIIRMASTRAKARVLRDFTNVGMTALEELGEANGDGNGKVQQQHKRSYKATGKSNGKQGNDGSKEGKDRATKNPIGKKDETQVPGQGKTVKEPYKEKQPNGKKTISVAQNRAVENLAKRRGISSEELEKMVQEKYNTPLSELTSQNASTFIRHLQTAA